MTAVYLRELNAYFRSMTGWLFAAFVLIFAGIYTMAYNLSGMYANFEYVLSAIAFIYLIAVPILTMRSLAEERRQRTDKLLYALPISLTQVTLGKYAAMLTVLALPTAVMGLYPLILSAFGDVSLCTAYGTLLGFFLLGACLMSIGLFISAMTESQVTAAVLTLVTMLLLYFMRDLSSFLPQQAEASLAALAVVILLFALIVLMLTKSPVIAGAAAVLGIGVLLIAYAMDSSAFTRLFAACMAQLSVFDRFETFVEGIFDLNAVVYDLSVAAVCLFLTVQALEKRRWSE